MIDPNETPEKEEPVQTESPVLEIARQYFLELAKNSDSMRKQMQDARTNTKRDYFLKKLKKNNKEALNLLSRLSAAEQAKALRQATGESQSESSE